MKGVIYESDRKWLCF